MVSFQHTLGNRVVVAFLEAAQTKLTVSAAGDRDEQEADLVAAEVVAGSETDDVSVAHRPEEVPVAGPPMAARVHRRAGRPGDPVGPEGGEVAAPLENEVDSARGGGSPLPTAMRSSMDTAFGADFSGVRLHRGEQSNALNRQLGATAFTVGSDIFLSHSAPELTTRAGKSLLAHELTHTIQQQGGGGSASPVGRDAIQRFPAQVLSDPPIPPIDWAADSASVSKSSEGLSGGVYFVRTKNPEDPVSSVVIKPVFGENDLGVETAPQLVMGDRVASALFGIGTPTSRIVESGTPEFEKLVTLTQGLATRPTDPLESERWKPVEEAQAMIVMGAVPNAVSLQSLAEKAFDDPNAQERLHEAVLQPSFLHDLGKLMVADLLMGNRDRMVAGAMNVGNLMVSSSKEGHKLYAIDSTVALGEFKPEDVVEHGSTALNKNFGADAKTQLDTPTEVYLDQFFEVLGNWYKGGTEKLKKGQGRTVAEGALDPSEALKWAYEAVRGRAIEAFEGGWQAGLAIIQELADTKEGQAKMRGLSEEVAGKQGSENARYAPMKVNAAYLSGRAKGQSHEVAAKDAAVEAALAHLSSMFDAASYRLPQDDQYYWTRLEPLSSSAYSAALESIDELPPPGDMHLEAVTRFLQGKFEASQAGKLRRMTAKLDRAMANIDGLGTKQRGLSGKEQPRNRQLAGHFVIQSYLVGAGGVRAASFARKLNDLAKLFSPLFGHKLDPTAAGQAMPAAQFLMTYSDTLREDLSHYVTTLRAAAKTVRKLKNYAAKEDLAPVLETAAAYVSACTDKFLDDSVKNANLYYNVLNSARRRGQR